MPRKLALKRLTASDPALFKWHFTNSDKGSRKVFNLYNRVLVGALNPRAYLFTADDDWAELLPAFDKLLKDGRSKLLRLAQATVSKEKKSKTPSSPCRRGCSHTFSHPATLRSVGRPALGADSEGPQDLRSSLFLMHLHHSSPLSVMLTH